MLPSRGMFAMRQSTTAIRQRLARGGPNVPVPLGGASRRYMERARLLDPAKAASLRGLSTTPASRHGSVSKSGPITVKFITPEGKTITCMASEGDSLLDIAHANDVELEGACEGSLACSTCHVILESDVYDRLEEPGDEENDMLDLAFGLTDTSRLGCQVKMTADLDGLIAQIPSATRNMAVDGYKPKPH